MNLAFIYAGGRCQRLDRIRAGLAADDFLYGSIQLERVGHNISVRDISTTKRLKVIQLVGNQLFKLRILPHKLDGGVLIGVWEAIKALQNIDVLVVAGTPQALAATLLKSLKLIRTPVVGIHAGIFNYKQNLFQRTVLKILFRRHTTVLFGIGEYDSLCDLVGRESNATVRVIDCCTDTQFWTPGGNEGDYILAVGNDSRRDFELLVAVARRMECKIKIVTSRSIKGSIPDNVEILRGEMREEVISDLDLRELYRRSLFVVVPLIESLQPSGQSVCLQAMATGKAVVLSETHGFWGRGVLRHDENIVLVEPNSFYSLRNGIESLLSSAEYRSKIGASGRKTVECNWPMGVWSEQLETVCARVSS